MSREVKRVALDFEWPLNKVWTGYLSFEKLEPPKGEGWQMWETTSEGSPISPVKETPEELAKWLADNNASSFGLIGATYEQWLGMINAGWALSAVCDSKGFRSGVEAASDYD